MTTRMMLALALAMFAAIPFAGCDDAPSTVTVTNGYGDATVRKVWWNTTLITGPIEPLLSSAPERAVAGSDFAYALIEAGLPGGSPRPLIALKSAERLTVARGGQLVIDVFDTTFDGNCFATAGLDEETARFITERIFPGDFAGAHYDGPTCTITPAATDAGADQ